MASRYVARMRIKSIKLLLGLMLAGSLTGFASNEPRAIVWSPLLELAGHTDIAWIYHEEDGRTRVMLPGHEARLFSGLRRLEIDDALYWMNGPLLYQEHEWVVPEADLQQTLVPLLAPEEQQAGMAPFIVVLDPGHGDHDPGGVAQQTVYEKDIVLDIAKRLRRQLIQAGITVKMTRDQDVFIALEERPRIATRKQASIFISIHANKAHNRYVRGIESFILPAPGFPATSEKLFPPDTTPLPGNRFDGQNLLLADAVHQPLLRATGAPDRGIKRERFAVLRDAPCPAVLLEVGFLSHEQERENLQDGAYRDKIVQGILTGILAFKESHGPQDTEPEAGQPAETAEAEPVEAAESPAAPADAAQGVS